MTRTLSRLEELRKLLDDILKELTLEEEKVKASQPSVQPRVSVIKPLKEVYETLGLLETKGISPEEAGERLIAHGLCFKHRVKGEILTKEQAAERLNIPQHLFNIRVKQEEMEVCYTKSGTLLDWDSVSPRKIIRPTRLLNGFKAPVIKQEPLRPAKIALPAREEPKAEKPVDDVIGNKEIASLFQEIKQLKKEAARKQLKKIPGKKEGWMDENGDLYYTVDQLYRKYADKQEMQKYNFYTILNKHHIYPIRNNDIRVGVFNERLFRQAFAKEHEQ